MKMKKSERLEYMARRARELAESGKYDDYISIETTLRSEGYPEARQYLDNRFLREELNEICRQAKTRNID